MHVCGLSGDRMRRSRRHVRRDADSSVIVSAHQERRRRPRDEWENGKGEPAKAKCDTETDD